MANRARAFAALSKLADFQRLALSAQQRALAILERADKEGRDLDNRETAVIEKCASVLTDDVKRNLTMAVESDGKVSSGS